VNADERHLEDPRPSISSGRPLGWLVNEVGVPHVPLGHAAAGELDDDAVEAGPSAHPHVGDESRVPADRVAVVGQRVRVERRR
jgi:hypothetical protein